MQCVFKVWSAPAQRQLIAGTAPVQGLLSPCSAPAQFLLSIQLELIQHLLSTQTDVAHCSAHAQHLSNAYSALAKLKMGYKNSNLSLENMHFTFGHVQNWHLKMINEWLSAIEALVVMIKMAFFLSHDMSKGSFNNHVDKREWVVGLKFAIFVHV